MTLIGDTQAEVNSEAKTLGTNTANTKATPKAEDSGSKVFNSFEETTPINTEEVPASVAANSKLPGRPPASKVAPPKINETYYTEEEIAVTPKEKEAFVDALITGDRYKQSFSLFGGRITGTFRSRTADETAALFTYIQYLVTHKKANLSEVENEVAFIPLVAQVETLNGVTYPEMKAPYSFERAEGTLKQPGWFPELAHWKAKPEALVSAIINKLQLFEYKYWLMAKEANNANFWNSDTSTEQSKSVSAAH